MSGDIGKGATREAITFAVQLAATRNKPHGRYVGYFFMKNVSDDCIFFKIASIIQQLFFSLCRVLSVGWWH